MNPIDTINIAGCQLEVSHIASALANQQKRHLVFLHEGLGSVAMWREWPAELAQSMGRDAWVYSRRGYGQSSPVPDVRGPSTNLNGQRTGRLLPDYLHHEAWDVLPALLRKLGIAAPVLVGHSDGGSIALLYASKFPVTACVVMAPHVMVEDISIAAIQQAKLAFESGDLRSRLQHFHADVDGAFWQWNDVWLSSGFRSFDIRADCARIQAPVLAIQGRQDPYGTLRQIEEIDLPREQNDRLPPSNGHITLHKLEHCGHSPQRDQTALTSQIITDWLAQLG